MSALCSDAKVTREWLEERKRDVQKMGKWSVWVPELHKYRAKYKQDEQEKTSSQLHYHSEVCGQWDIWKEMNTFIQQGCIKLIKSDSKDNIMLRFQFEINAVLLNLLFSKESWQKYIQFPQKYYSTTVFNIDNDDKCVSSRKSAY